MHATEFIHPYTLSINCRESAFLVPEDNNKSSSAKHKERVASVVAHELAHQWFGNLVTPRWWNDLWLKEGFATYMSYECLNFVSFVIIRPLYISETNVLLCFRLRKSGMCLKRLSRTNFRRLSRRIPIATRTQFLFQLIVPRTSAGFLIPYRTPKGRLLSE